MKLIVIALALALVGVTAPAIARPPAQAPSASAPRPAVHGTVDESQLIEHKNYHTQSGQTVHSPAHAANGVGVPSGASAHCRDGTYSFSQHHQGTCSHHGGVAGWL